HHRRRLGGGARAESQPLRRTRDTGGRHVAEYARQRGGMGARSAAAQARREDARARSHRRSGQGARRVSHGTEVMAVPHALRHHEIAHVETTGLLSWLTTLDHKRIGILYGVSALTFFLIGGVEALVIKLQLRGPPPGLLS